MLVTWNDSYITSLLIVKNTIANVLEKSTIFSEEGTLMLSIPTMEMALQCLRLYVEGNVIELDFEEMDLCAIHT